MMKRSHRTYRRLRNYVITQEPFCRPCAEAGRTVLAVEVDHIKELQHGGAMLDEDNLQPICHACHVAKTKGQARKSVGFTKDGLPLEGW